MSITSGMTGAVGTVHTMTQPSSDANVPASHLPSTSPGKGVMQGTLVGVGTREGGLALQQDSASSRGMFSRVLGTLGNALWAAHQFASTHLGSPDDFAAMDPVVEDDIDEESVVSERSVSSSHDNENDDDDVSVGDSTVSTAADEDGDVSDIDDDDEEFFDCVSTEEELLALQARSGSKTSSADSRTQVADDAELVEPDEESLDGHSDDSRPLSSAPKDGGTSPRTVSTSHTGVSAERLADNLNIPILSMKDLMGEDLPPIVLGDPKEREVSEKAIEKQESGVMAWVKWGARGALSVAGNVASGALTVAGGVASGAVTVAKGAYNLTVGSGQSAEKAVAKEAPSQTFAEKNLAEAQVLAKNINTAMAKLNLQLQKLGAGDIVGGSGAAKQELEQPELTTRDTLNRWYYQARGGASAAVSTLGQMAAGAGVAFVGDAVGTVTASLPLKALSLLGGAYVGLTALRDYPELANNKAAVAMIEAEMKAILPDMLKLDDIMGQERARQTGAVRALLVMEARSPRIDSLKTELDGVTKALQRAEAGEVGTTPQLRHAVALGDGKERVQTLSVGARAREAFTSFFSSIGSRLASIGRAITNIPNVINAIFERRAAGKAEQAYANDAKVMFDVLAEPTKKQTHITGVDVGAFERAQEAGSSASLPEVRKQCRMGENLTRALLTQEGQSFGAVAYRDGSKPVAVAATLTTARAMAWYLDAIASQEIDDPDAPKVIRNEDGSLTIDDPDRKLYSYLMNVPVAYTGTTEDANGQQSLGFMIDDHRQGMPQGMHGMRFETRLDDDGNEQLHLSFTAKKSEAVFEPLGNESEQLTKMYQALHSSHKPPVSEGQDFSSWPEDRLRARQNELVGQLEREHQLASGDRQQQAALEEWHNPDFFSGRV